MAEMREIEVKVRPMFAIAQPGDTLVLCVGAKHLSVAEAESIKESVMAEIPGLEKVVVVPADGMIIYRPGDTLPLPDREVITEDTEERDG